MALPSNASTGIVTGTFVDGAGNPLAGTVTFTPSTAVLDAGGNTIIAPAALTTTLDANGSFTITLVATDDPDLNPSGWTWGVRFSFATASIAAFSFAVPSNSTTDLSAAAPVPSSPGNAITKGDPGNPSIYELRGAGSPVGVVTPASAGIYYTDTAGTNGAWRWLSTGTTNTSWIVDLGDTGWRDISSLLDGASFAKSSSNGMCVIRRTNNVVFFAANLNVLATNVTTIMSPIPAGFTGDASPTITEPGVLRTVGVANSGLPSGAAQWYLGGAGVTIRSQSALPSPGTMMLTAQWITTDAWPTTLPGTPA